MQNKNESLIKSEADLVFTRTIDAPARLVFKAWTDQWLLAKWWGPKDFTNPLCELDVKPDGRIRVDMRGPDGTVYSMGGMFHQIIEPHKLVFTSTALEDEWGDARLKNLNTVRFEDQNGKTRVTVSIQILKAADEVASSIEEMPAGWNESLDKLETLLVTE